MTPRAYGIIIAGFFTVSIAYAIRYGYGMLLPEMLPDFGISKTQAGGIFAVYFGVYTIFTPLMGALSDRYSYRFILTLFTAVMALGALLMAYAGTAVQACMTFALAGLGHAACWAPVAALVQKWVPDGRRGTALSFVTMGVGLGIPLWGTLLPVIVAASGWRAGWLGLGGFGLAAAALNLLLVRNPGHSGRGGRVAAAPPAADPFWVSYRSLIRSRTFWIIGTAYLLVGFNVLVPFTFLPVYARESLHLSYAASTRFVGIIAVAGIGGQLILGTLSDAVGRIQVMMLCSTIMGVTCLVMASCHTAWGLYAAAAVYGLGYGAVWPVYAAAASDFFQTRNAGSVVGLWTVFLGAGSVVSPVICGWTIDRTGSYNWSFMLGMGSGILSALLLVNLLKQRRTKRLATGP